MACGGKKSSACGWGCCQEDKKGCKCEACGMPLKSEKDCGVNADGSKNCKMCIHCCNKNGKKPADK